MQALQELYQETDKSYSQLLRSNRQTEERVSQLQFDNMTLEQKLEDLEGSIMEGDKVSSYSLDVLLLLLLH